MGIVGVRKLMQILCPSCGFKGEGVVLRKNPAYGLYCPNCGRWIKWLPKTQAEIILELAKKKEAAS